MAAQIILNNKQSTVSGPYAYYTVLIEPIDGTRTASSVQANVIVKWHLKYTDSWLGVGHTRTASIYLGDDWHSIVIKDSNETINGTGERTDTGTFTISGLSETQEVLTGIKFKVESNNSSYLGGSLSETDCSNLFIPYYTEPELPSASPLVDTSRISGITYIYVHGSWV